MARLYPCGHIENNVYNNISSNTNVKQAMFYRGSTFSGFCGWGALFYNSTGKAIVLNRIVANAGISAYSGSGNASTVDGIFECGDVGTAIPGTIGFSAVADIKTVVIPAVSGTVSGWPEASSLSIYVEAGHYFFVGLRAHGVTTRFNMSSCWLNSNNNPTTYYCQNDEGEKWTRDTSSVWHRQICHMYVDYSDYSSPPPADPPEVNASLSKNSVEFWQGDSTQVTVSNYNGVDYSEEGELRGSMSESTFTFTVTSYSIYTTEQSGEFKFKSSKGNLNTTLNATAKAPGYNSVSASKSELKPGQEAIISDSHDGSSKLSYANYNIDESTLWDVHLSKDTIKSVISISNGNKLRFDSISENNDWLNYEGDPSNAFDNIQITAHLLENNNVKRNSGNVKLCHWSPSDIAVSLSKNKMICKLGGNPTITNYTNLSDLYDSSFNTVTATLPETLKLNKLLNSSNIDRQTIYNKLCIESSNTDRYLVLFDSNGTKDSSKDITRNNSVSISLNLDENEILWLKDQETLDGSKTLWDILLEAYCYNLEPDGVTLDEDNPGKDYNITVRLTNDYPVKSEVALTLMPSYDFKFIYPKNKSDEEINGHKYYVTTETLPIHVNKDGTLNVFNYPIRLQTETISDEGGADINIELIDYNEDKPYVQFKYGNSTSDKQYINVLLSEGDKVIKEGRWQTIMLNCVESVSIPNDIISRLSNVSSIPGDYHDADNNLRLYMSLPIHAVNNEKGYNKIINLTFCMDVFNSMDISNTRRNMQIRYDSVEKTVARKLTNEPDYTIRRAVCDTQRISFMYGKLNEDNSWVNDNSLVNKPFGCNDFSKIDAEFFNLKDGEIEKDSNNCNKNGKKIEDTQEYIDKLLFAMNQVIADLSTNDDSSGRCKSDAKLVERLTDNRPRPKIASGFPVMWDDSDLLVNEGTESSPNYSFNFNDYGDSRTVQDLSNNHQLKFDIATGKWDYSLDYDNDGKDDISWNYDDLSANKDKDGNTIPINLKYYTASPIGDLVRIIAAFQKSVPLASVYCDVNDNNVVDDEDPLVCVIDSSDGEICVLGVADFGDPISEETDD